MFEELSSENAEIAHSFDNLPKQHLKEIKDTKIDRVNKLFDIFRDRSKFYEARYGLFGS